MATNVVSRTGNRTGPHTPERAGESIKISRYGDEEVESLRKETYAQHIKDGYTFMTNAPVTARDCEKSVEERVNIYKGRGYDVMVHETAFDTLGRILPTYRAILVKSNARGLLG